MEEVLKRKSRAPRMSTEDRRRAIVAAALPLFAASGPAVSTADIAAAADIAEGTIFRVFKDKDALVIACLEAMADTSQLARALAAVSRELDVEEAVVQVALATAEYLGTALSTVFALSSRQADQRAKALWANMNTQTQSLVASALQAHSEQLGVPVRQAARALYAAMLGTVMLGESYTPTRREVRATAKLVAHGICN